MMNRRLRKKKRIGEFTEWGQQIIVRRNCRDGFDEFLDAFIDEAIEANGCYCGGGGKEDRLDVVVELGRSTQNLEARSQKVTAWLDARSDVESYAVGDLFDLWHGPFQDIGGVSNDAGAGDGGEGVRVTGPSHSPAAPGPQR